MNDITREEQTRSAKPNQGQTSDRKDQLPPSCRDEVRRPCHTALLDIQPDCVANAIDKMSGKWTLRIILHLLDDKKRFSELRRLLPGVTRGTLSYGLRRLAKDGIIHRTQYPTIPPTVEYKLTVKGMALRPILAVLSDWSCQGETDL